MDITSYFYKNKGTKQVKRTMHGNSSSSKKSEIRMGLEQREITSDQ